MTAAATLVELAPEPESETLAPDTIIDLARQDMAQGRGAEAVARLQALMAQVEPDPMLHYWLAAAFGAAGERDAQRETLKDAQTFHALQLVRDMGGDLDRFQSDAVYAAQLGQKFYQAKLMGPAAVCFGQAAMTPFADSEVMHAWGLSLQHQGRMEEALTAFTAALRLRPGPRLHEFLLYACFFVEGGVELHAQEVRAWADLYAPAHTAPHAPFDRRALQGRPLRLGYVAPSFAGTQVRQFLMPVLDHHDASAVEVYLYCADAAAEPQLPAAAIRSIGALNAQDAAALIRGDEIDLLVDLWGHTAGGRLDVFALKPAPVQTAWINYVQSTGLKTMDYVIHAECMDVPGTEALFTETPWRLPIMAPFRPDARPEPTPTPARARGHVTFGCFNHPAKLSDQTIAAWARILNGAPGSRLVLKYGYFVDPMLQNATCARFAAHGVDPSRIDFRGHSAGPDYLREFADIDLALDPSPCPGGTTSSDAIANGVPVLTLRGRDFYSCIGIVCVEPLGLHELVTDSWDEYVARALELTCDVEALDRLRRRTRESFEASLARDEAGFTRLLEAAFTEMYRRWEAGHG